MFGAKEDFLKKNEIKFAREGFWFYLCTVFAPDAGREGEERRLKELHRDESSTNNEVDFLPRRDLWRIEVSLNFR